MRWVNRMHSAVIFRNAFQSKTFSWQSYYWRKKFCCSRERLRGMAINFWQLLIVYSRTANSDILWYFWRRVFSNITWSHPYSKKKGSIFPLKMKVPFFEKKKGVLWYSKNGYFSRIQEMLKVIMQDRCKYCWNSIDASQQWFSEINVDGKLSSTIWVRFFKTLRLISRKKWIHMDMHALLIV